MSDHFLIDFLTKERIRELQHEAEGFRRAREVKRSHKPHRRHRWWR
jgi:hypothetical protein